MTNKFNFYDVVKVVSTKISLRNINDSEGVILGMSQNEATGRWGYAVSIYKDEGLVWDVMEEDLKSTGKKVDSKSFQTGDVIKVQVDPKSGKGNFIDNK